MIGINQHSPYTDQLRWKRELALIKELGCTSVRIGWGTDKLIDSSGSRLQNWGQSLVKDSLQRYADNGLTVHVTLNMAQAYGSSRSLVRESALFVLDEVRKRFKPSGASFSLENEVPSLVQRQKDTRLHEFADDTMSIFRGSGYTLYGPCQHGWSVWPKHDLWCFGRELAEQDRRTKDNYHSGLHPYMKHLPAAHNLYVSSAWDDPVQCAIEKLRMQAEVSEQATGQKVLLSELGIVVPTVKPISDYRWGQLMGILCREVKATGIAAGIFAYCLAEDVEHAFMSADGFRFESRIKGWKSAFR